MPRDIHGSPRPFLIKVGCSEEHTQNHYFCRSWLVMAPRGHDEKADLRLHQSTGEASSRLCPLEPGLALTS